MGSSGSGNFSDYSGRPTTGSSSSKTGGTSDEDKCGKAFSCSLDEVQNCGYFKKHKKVPAANTIVSVAFQNPRLAVVTEEDLVVGYLPTSRNYVRGCLMSGYVFPGVVTTSRMKPIPSVELTVSPHL